LKRKQRLRHSVLEHAHILRLQRRDEAMLFVSYRKRKIGNIRFDANHIFLIDSLCPLCCGSS